MGKLVLFLKDASPVEIPLAKERVTIGRRADNDVCLPYPAVSGEHAAVVTILADSFLEDLGSTNGTLVNGRPVAKHFLRDRDQIDIGRQLLVYVADVAGRVDPPASVQAREDRRELNERIAPLPTPAKAVPGASPVDDDLAAELRVPPQAMRMDTRSAPAPAPRAPGPDREPPIDAPSFDADLAAIRMSRAESANVPPPDPPGPIAESAAHARLRVLTGPTAGRIVPIAREEFVVGRVGVQVAAIVKRGGALLLVPREGNAPPTVNGETVPVDGRPISPGDGFEVAGVRLELLAPE